MMHDAVAGVSRSENNAQIAPDPHRRFRELATIHSPAKR
jgi:hypothetical protein